MKFKRKQYNVGDKMGINKEIIGCQIFGNYFYVQQLNKFVFGYVNIYYVEYIIDIIFLGGKIRING